MKNKRKPLFVIAFALLIIIVITIFAYNELIARKADYKIYLNGQLAESSMPFVTSIVEFIEMLEFDVERNEKDRIINIEGEVGVIDIYNNLSEDEISAVLEFKNISIGDRLQNVFESIRKPDRDAGSGIYIYEFDISDNVQIMIYSHNNETVLSVKLRIGENRYDITKD